MAWLGALSVQFVRAQESALIEKGETWDYFKGTVAPPADWKDLAFVPAAPDWLSGPTGIGYADGDDATVLTDMMMTAAQTGYVAFFARKPFTVASLASISKLTLVIDYDDGFVAYLNGTEVARRGLGAAGSAVAFDQLATGREAGAPEYIDIDPTRTILAEGPNVLAIELHNTAITSSDASLIPRLVANSNSPTTNLTCAVAAGSVVLNWTNNGGYDSIRVERNGTTLAVLAGDEATYTDTAPSTLDNVYRAVGVIGDLDLPSNTCTIACTQGVLTCQLRLVGGVTTADVSWSGVTDVTQAQVYREGALVATLTGGETSYHDPNVEDLMAEDDTDFRVVLTTASGGICTLVCGLSLCPTLSAEAVGGTIVLTIGNNVKAWDHFEISRNGVVVDPNVPGSATSWNDPDVVLVPGDSYDYFLHPVAVGAGALPAPGTVCDRALTLGYVPEVGSYDPPTGGWDYIINFDGPGDRKYTPSTGVVGNLDGRWIRSVDRDLWNGQGPDDPTGPAPAGPAPGGLDIKTEPGLGPCHEGDASALRILDPGNTGAPIGTAFPEAFDPPGNSSILLGLDLGITDRNVLKSGITISTRLRLPEDAPAYMNAVPASGDGEPISAGIGMVGVYYKDTGALPAEGLTAGAAVGLNSGAGGGLLEVSTNPVTDIDAAGTHKFIAVWMTVQGGANPNTYDVKVYVNGATNTSDEVSGTGVALLGGMADFGPGVVNYLAIGSNDTAQDAFLEIDYVAYKLGVFAPGVTPCEGVPPPGARFHRGDADDNGSLQLTDALRVLGFLFLGQAAPTCMDSADADDNGSLQLTDALRILGFLFLGGPPPSAPGPPPEACGADPTVDDALDCATYNSCP